MIDFVYVGGCLPYMISDFVQVYYISDCKLREAGFEKGPGQTTVKK